MGTRSPYPDSWLLPVSEVGYSPSTVRYLHSIQVRHVWQVLPCSAWGLCNEYLGFPEESVWEAEWERVLQGLDLVPGTVVPRELVPVLQTACPAPPPLFPSPVRQTLVPGGRYPVRNLKLERRHLLTPVEDTDAPVRHQHRMREAGLRWIWQIVALDAWEIAERGIAPYRYSGFMNWYFLEEVGLCMGMDLPSERVDELRAACAE